jgi:hypothetical protein
VARLSEDMIREMNEMIENQLQCVQGLDRIEKMKMKTKIRQQSRWLGAVLNPSPKVIMEKMQKKMPDVFSALPCGFRDELKDFLEENTRNFGKRH